MNNNKGFAGIGLMVAIIVLLGGTAGYFMVMKKSAPPTNEEAQSSLPSPSPQAQANQPTPTPTSQVAAKDETAGWKTYTNVQYGFEIKYPVAATLNASAGSTEVTIEFEKESSFYNMARIALFVYPKGTFSHYPQSDKCKIYERSVKTIGNKVADVVEQSDCPGSEGSPTGGSGHTLTAIIALSSTKDLIYRANLNNAFIAQNNYGVKILDTLSF